MDLKIDETDTRIGKLQFEHGVPTLATVKHLYNQMDFQRACQLYLWALPVVGMEQGRDAAESTTGARLGDVGIFKGYRNVSIFFTTNVTTPYSIGYQDLSKGPLVIDMPPGAIAGSINDFWQRAITDLGITGPDQGKGGKYVLVGPGQEAPVAEGAFVLRSPTFGIVLFYRRSIPIRRRPRRFRAACASILGPSALIRPPPAFLHLIRTKSRNS
jgi:hypothetical protein